MTAPSQTNVTSQVNLKEKETSKKWNACLAKEM